MRDNTVCLRITYVCFVPRRFPVNRRGHKYQHKQISSMFEILLESDLQNQKNSCRFKTLIEIVRQILIKWETSSIKLSLVSQPSNLDNWTMRQTCGKDVSRTSGGDEKLNRAFNAMQAHSVNLMRPLQLRTKHLKQVITFFVVWWKHFENDVVYCMT